jgi:hypothetical protein
MLCTPSARTIAYSKLVYKEKLAAIGAALSRKALKFAQ